ncbi:NADH-quinone oxidoreductase subunit N [Methylomonas sp. AM2-LC]|uniref:NADH-quinone oxidoreductase subunit N n=1 Tax=Methylomonas sp. AM2-LC TaxID=3153301 RepID=UPI003265D2D0
MNVTQLIALGPMIALAGAAVAIMLSIAVKRSFVLASVLAAGGMLSALLMLIYQWREDPLQITALIRMDGFAHYYLFLLLLTGLAIVGFCYDYFKAQQGENEELPLLLLTALLGCSVLISSTHFASFFMGLEILSISLFALIGYPLNQARPLEAAIKYLVLSGVSSAFLLLGMALIYAQSGELFFNAIGHYMADLQSLNRMILCGILLIVVGLGFKLSLIPFHLWTPDVYQGAPAPITAFIATASKASVFALLLRYFNTTDSFTYLPLQMVVSLIAGLSILGGNLLALLQNNVKRLLAYSSIAHLGYLLVAFVAGRGASTEIANEAITFYLSAYLITLLGAFGVISMLSSPQEEAEDISNYRGLFWRRPGLATAFTLMLLSLAGIPLTAGFIGKFYIFVSAMDKQLWGLLCAVIIGSGVGLYYYLKIIVVMSMKVEATDIEFSKPYPPARISISILVSLILLLIWLGVYPSLVIDAIQEKLITSEVVDQTVNFCWYDFGCAGNIN